MLELPKLVFPITGMTIGWPDGEFGLRPRLPLSAISHQEKYDSTTFEYSLRRYDKEMFDTGIYNNRQVSTADQTDDLEFYGWLEHTARRISKTIRPDLSEAIKRQGFELN